MLVYLRCKRKKGGGEKWVVGMRNDGQWRCKNDDFQRDRGG